jgi:hypothetical protein
MSRSTWGNIVLAAALLLSVTSDETTDVMAAYIQTQNGFDDEKVVPDEPPVDSFDDSNAALDAAQVIVAEGPSLDPDKVIDHAAVESAQSIAEEQKDVAAASRAMATALEGAAARGATIQLLLDVANDLATNAEAAATSAAADETQAEAKEALDKGGAQGTCFGACKLGEDCLVDDDCSSGHCEDIFSRYKLCGVPPTISPTMTPTEDPMESSATAAPAYYYSSNAADSSDSQYLTQLNSLLPAVATMQSDTGEVYGGVGAIDTGAAGLAAQQEAETDGGGGIRSVGGGIASVGVGTEPGIEEMEPGLVGMEPGIVRMEPGMVSASLGQQQTVVVDAQRGQSRSGGASSSWYRAVRGTDVCLALVAAGLAIALALLATTAYAHKQRAAASAKKSKEAEPTGQHCDQRVLSAVQLLPVSI